jgi:hypothetical protein
MNENEFSKKHHLSGMGKTVRCYMKNKSGKKGQECGKVEEHLPSKHEALSSNINTTNRKKNLCRF